VATAAAGVETEDLAPAEANLQTAARTRAAALEPALRRAARTGLRFVL